MKSINAEKELNKEDRFTIFTPIVALWEMLKEMANSDAVLEDKEYTESDYVSMARHGKEEIENYREVAKELSKPIQAEKIVAEVKKKRAQEMLNDIEVGQKENSNKVEVVSKVKDVKDDKEVEDEEISL